MELSSRDALACTLALALFGYLYHRRARTHSRPPVPPGPPKLPILGNLLQLPIGGPVWEIWAEWSRKYESDVIHVKVPGTSLVVVNSLQAAKELFERRSSIYSSRPRFPMAGELVGWGWQFTIQAYGARWREQRRLFTQYFHPSKVRNHQPLLARQAHILLHRLLDPQENFMHAYQHVMAAMSISLAYGINVLPANDPHVYLAEKALNGFGQAATPGAFLVDALPILKHVPSFLPGAGFKRKAAEWRNWMIDFVEIPFAAAQKEIEEGVAHPSFTSHYLDNNNQSQVSAEGMQNIKEISATIFTAGAHTTASLLLSLTLVMILYPDVQRKIHEELDRVIGHGRLPDWEDEESLPYLKATIKETLRWKPITPVAIPHSVIDDDVYNGYHIPKGSTVIGNTWAMLYNEEVYPNPTEFRPERFLKDEKLNLEVPDPVEVAFGFGRRICPGIHIGMAMTYISIASLLSVFDLSKAVDSEGKTIEPSGEYDHIIVSQPMPFKCVFTPRSSEAVKLVHGLNF
ncbi:hypothetical protein AMATHDRAFT_67760 [Amanita thiersii Skay4041]|uniref:Cytochrome P450 n=1 Tax=Amanita thiersii Skay4041 TaxID=703135 RepID=A0A2A9NI35_9AGAR|nr:hypothetical protein AMATHDRAFT_67760 [Amanita thiersii Skay4041]